MGSGAGDTTGGAAGGSIMLGGTLGMGGDSGGACTLVGDCGERWELDGMSEEKNRKSSLIESICAYLM